jgi:hypothetical protein
MLQMLDAGQATPRQVDGLVKGVNLDRLSQDDASLLDSMILQGREKAISYLLDKGASPNRESRYGGTALTWAIRSQSLDDGATLRVVKQMLDAGANLNAKVKPDSVTVIETIIEHVTEELKDANDRSLDGDSRRDSRQQVALYRKVLPLLLGRNPTLSERANLQLKAFQGGAATPKKSPKFAPQKVRALIKAGDRSSLCDVCRLLANEVAVAHAAWSDLVRAAIDSSRTFEEVSREVYGHAVSFVADEGSLCQGWGEYVVLDLIIELLAEEAALRNPAWASLVEYALSVRGRYDAESYTDQAVEKLFAQPWVKAHPSAKRLRAIAKRTG